MLLNCGAEENSWVPWIARRSNQSILREMNPKYSLEGLKLKLKLQYFGHPMWRVNSWKRFSRWERLKAKGEAGDRGWDGWISLTQWTWIGANSRRQWRTEKSGVLQSMGLQRVGHDLATEQKQRVVDGRQDSGVRLLGSNPRSNSLSKLPAGSPWVRDSSR